MLGSPFIKPFEERAKKWAEQLSLIQVKQSTGHTHTGHTDRENTPDTSTHTRTTRPPNEHLPQALNNAQRWRDDGNINRVNSIQRNRLAWPHRRR